jgi:hypothetical protein
MEGGPPHALRKSFEEGENRRRPDGTMMGEKDQEFLMGHVLPVSQDPATDRASASRA